ncbi:MAG: AAC(3) family N-acetyltransferase, partial [Halorientalis sp.]
CRSQRAEVNSERLSDATNPFEFVVDHLDARFDSILTPAFTQSFRDTGYFHREESEPELGAFASLAFETADYRTADPLHSISVLGDYRFEDCDHHDTFGPDGCYAKLDADDVRILNVGTRWLISTQIHYVERRMDVPYTETVDVEGTVYHGNGTHEQVAQTTYDKNKYVYYWDRLRIMRDLLEDGVLDHYDLNGLKVISVSAQDLREGLEPRIEDDPYYLVK